MPETVLGSDAFLVLADEFERLQKEDVGGLKLMVKLSEAALKATGQSPNGLGVREIVERAKPLVRDFFAALHASVGMTGELGTPSQAGSSES